MYTSRCKDILNAKRNIETALPPTSRLRLPILATNGVCYARREQRAVADVFTCLRYKRRLDTAGKLLCRNSEKYLRSPSEMEQLFLRSA
jgi:DNA polymerase III alpha subunit